MNDVYDFIMAFAACMSIIYIAFMVEFLISCWEDDSQE